MGLRRSKHGDNIVGSAGSRIDILPLIDCLGILADQIVWQDFADIAYRIAHICRIVGAPAEPESLDGCPSDDVRERHYIKVTSIHKRGTGSPITIARHRDGGCLFPAREK